MQKQMKEKKKEKKIYRGGFQTVSIDHFQKWIFLIYIYIYIYLSIEAVI